MINKISSQEINDIMTAAKGRLDETNKKFEKAKEEIQDRIKIIKYESEYAATIQSKIMSGAYAKVDGLTCFSKLTGGKYTRYGSTIHAKLIKDPINVFNLHCSGLGDAFFREDVKVAINNNERGSLVGDAWENEFTYKEEYLNLLKDDIIEDKGIFFDTYKNKHLTIRVELSSLSSILGPTRFNCIEIDPFLHGSFDIKAVYIYPFDEEGNTVSEPEILEPMENVGKQRIMLPNKINFYKIEFDIQINYESYPGITPVYPFGLKHLYFYDMDFHTDSYLIAELKADKYISYVKNEISVKTPYGFSSAQIGSSGIGLYLDRNGEALTSEIESSTSTNINELARSTKTIYAHIPISTSLSLIGMAFSLVERTNS